MNSPYITNYRAISLGILPNNVDFRGYYIDPAAKEPAGNDLLIFDVVSQNLLRTYYLLYPSMKPGLSAQFGNRANAGRERHFGAYRNVTLDG